MTEQRTGTGIREFAAKEQAFPVNIRGKEVYCTGLDIREEKTGKQIDDLCEGLTVDRPERHYRGAENGVIPESFRFYVSEGVMYIVPETSGEQEEWKALQNEGVSGKEPEIVGRIELSEKDEMEQRTREVVIEKSMDPVALEKLHSGVLKSEYFNWN